MAFGIFSWDLLFLHYLDVIPKATEASCIIISKELCSTVSADYYAIIISIWATLQLVWVAMLITVQLLQIARGLTTYEAMSPSKPHSHSHSVATQAASFVAAGDPSISAAGLGPNNRGPDPAVADAAHAHPHKGGMWETWKRLLGVDTFVAVALHGRGTTAQNGHSHSHAPSRNPFSKGCFSNCQDFWMDEGPWFGSRESGMATFGGERVDYTSMYDVPAGRGYAPVSADEEV